jgi:hypothetical protein
MEKIRAFFQGAEGRFWSIYVTFPAPYPVHPPFVRFTNIPYHPNISSEGRVLFSLVEHEYNPDVTVCQIIERVKAILAEPELRDSIQKSVRDEFNDNPAEYARKAGEVAERDGKMAIADFDFAPPGVRLYVEDGGEVVDRERNDLRCSQLSLVRSISVPIVVVPDSDEFGDFG